MVRFALALSFVLLLACGPAPKIEQTTFASSLGVDLSQSTKTSTGLYYRDTNPGTGATVATGLVLNAGYTGWLADGTQFDTGQNFIFKVGNGDVIAGWDQGVVGMKVGGTRQLIIPPSLGYGGSDYGPIPGNSILVFSIRAIAVAQP